MELRRLAKGMLADAPLDGTLRFLEIEQKAKPEAEIKAEMIKAGYDTMKATTTVI